MGTSALSFRARASRPLSERGGGVRLATRVCLHQKTNPVPIVHGTVMDGLIQYQAQGAKKRTGKPVLFFVNHHGSTKKIPYQYQGER
ncbi:hypothetical protein SAMN05444972_1217 [Marininema halotolerans]|uniref:Uncharacterized protein n=1 Tax=Marininema halotolerans TaxID=1155944 RepID=A0A1I6UU50_9BACL|nr:hypothetical protein SAMN05444972_1217 [Marininema halotolerans]